MIQDPAPSFTYLTSPSRLSTPSLPLVPTTRLALHKSPVNVFVLDPVDADLHFRDNILITFVFAC